MENPDIAPNAARCRFRRIVVKVGSNVLTRTDGTLDTDRMAALADQIAAPVSYTHLTLPTKA